MKLTLIILFIAWVAIDASRIRGSEHAPVDQSTRALYFRRRYPDNRKSGLTLFLVEDDSTSRTTSCTNDLADELYDGVDIVITDTDENTDPNDYVYYVDSNTDCERALADIENEIGCNTGYRMYYYGGNRRYWSDRNNRWYRYADNNKSKKDDYNDDGYAHRHRWWNGDGDSHRNRSWWHDHGDDHGRGDHGDGGNDNKENTKDDRNDKDGNR